MSYHPEQPFNDLPLLPPGKDSWESFALYNQLAEARAALAELKGRAPVIPNPKMLINTLVLQEAKDSSSIENIFTTSDNLYKAFSSNAVVPDAPTKEVLRYRQALWNGWQKSQKDGFSIDLIEEIYRTIKEETNGIRDKEVYIGNQFNVVYTPPCCKEVLTDKLQNWLDFALSSSDIDPIIKMALLHYQFEAIHPFSDGNGRTGRVLNVLFICLNDLLDQPILYLSKYINDNKGEYYRLLRAVTEKGNWADWILFNLKAITQTAIYTLDKVNAIHQLFIATIERVKTERPKIYSYELIELLFHQPYCKISMIVDSGIATRNTASKYLSELEKLGVLSTEKSGNEILYLNVELFKLLTNP
jgi:Fic family protein